jgi:inorganic pyrophosphatase
MKKELAKKVEWLRLTRVFDTPEKYPLTTGFLKQLENQLKFAPDTIETGDKLFSDLLEVINVATAYTDALLVMEEKHV